MEQNGSENEEIRWVTTSDLLELARHFNDAGVRYLVYGGIACILHGHIRATADLDICFGEDPNNIDKALGILSKWGHGYASELNVQEVLENVVVRIGDDITVDISSRIWKVDWQQAWDRRRIVNVDGVDIAVLSRQDLIASKRTYRDKDKWDVHELLGMAGPEPGQPASE